MVLVVEFVVAETVVAVRLVVMVMVLLLGMVVEVVL